MYSWATKEYLLWNMTLGQIILYHNKGIQIQSGIKESECELDKENISELKKITEQMKLEEMKRKYGEIENG